MSNYNTEIVQHNLIYDRCHDHILHSNNSSESLQLLTDMLNESLNVVALIKKIRIRKSKKNILIYLKKLKR